KKQREFELTRRQLLAGAVQVGIVIAADSHPLFGAISADTPLRPKSLEINPDARPWVYWFWFNGNFTREAITHDLEAMHEIGIGGVLVSCIDGGARPGPVKYMSPEWMQLTSHCIAEADRLDMQVDVSNCEGYTDAGGPWITPEMATQKLTWQEIRIEGGQTISRSLEKPPTLDDYYRDIALLAIPALPGTREQIPEPKIDYAPGKPSFITHDYGKTITARSAAVRIFYDGRAIGTAPLAFTLEASDDGVAYRTVYHFDNRWRASGQGYSNNLDVDIRIETVTARYFRMVIPYTDQLFVPTDDGKPDPRRCNGFELLGETHLSLWRSKAGHIYFIGIGLNQPDRYLRGWTNPFDEQGTTVPEPDPSCVLPLGAAMDVSSYLKGDDFQWDAPAGSWILVRIGCTRTEGGWLHPVPKSDGCRTVSMFNKEAMQVHFEHATAKVADANAKYIGAALNAAHMDSSECGPQNWSPNFAAEFEKRRGYSLMPWMPVLAGGRIVGSADQSERFLFDFRRTMADLIAENWGELRRLANSRNLRFTGEASGRQQFMNDPLLFLSNTDIPMGEFWPTEPEVRPDCAVSRSTANVHGKKVVMGEAYTSSAQQAMNQVKDYSAGWWMDHPYSLKAFGDRAFCTGVNHFTFHRCILQPQGNEYPGLAWAPNGYAIGINMDPTNTWWKPGAAWIAYLSRCQQMLQSGTCVVDVAVLHTENVPNVLVRPDGLPSGYHFDGLHYRMLPQVKVENGFLELPSGMRYRILVLQPGPMTPETAAEIARLVQAGATVAGAKPLQSPSLTNYPQCDLNLKAATDKWQGVYPDVVSALRAVNLKPDLSGLSELDFLFMHRTINGEDAYFISNQTAKEQNVVTEFRVASCTPRLFDSDTGTETEIAVFAQNDETTTVPLSFAPSGSLFVIFKHGLSESVVPAKGIGNSLGLALDGVELVRASDRGLSLITRRSGTMSFTSSRGRRISVSLPTLPERVVEGPWKLTFPPNWGAPAEIQLDKLLSWPNHKDEGVRHFSGTATYTTTFELSEDLTPDRALYLDLGEVQIVAEVTLNGKPVGTVWKPPFRCEVTDVVKPGLNTLRIAVTNLWPNRLIGDSALPEEKRFARTSFNPFKPDFPLLPSGLLGPVKLIFAHRRALQWS
ncbi:MAG: hypothetical protein FWD64_11315, partial [Acidobacteriaceae bacterium]|nr:hypothetical protein [Acidobacteriaceae bacterium]